MLITELGGLGIGLMWGWLIGIIASRVCPSLHNVVTLGMATGLLAIEVFWLTEYRVLRLFLGAAVFSFMFYWGWLRELRDRSKPFT